MMAGHDVVELNPAHVKAVRAQQGSRRLKTDRRDAAAIVDLVISGSGRPPQQRADALVEQVVWAGVRRRRVRARTALTNQPLGTLDLVFRGPVNKINREAACRHDVTHPPVTTVPRQHASRKTPLRT